MAHRPPPPSRQASQPGNATGSIFTGQTRPVSQTVAMFSGERSAMATYGGEHSPRLPQSSTGKAAHEHSPPVGNKSNADSSSVYKYKRPSMPNIADKQKKYGASRGAAGRMSKRLASGHTGPIRPRVATSLRTHKNSGPPPPGGGGGGIVGISGGIKKKVHRPIEKSYDPMKDPQLNPMMGINATFDMVGSSALLASAHTPGGPGNNGDSPNAAEVKSDIEVDSLECVSIDPLMHTMSYGTTSLKGFTDALSAFAKQQIQQSQKFKNMFTKSKETYAVDETMPSFTFAISLVHNMLEQTVDQQREFAAFIHDTCIPILLQLHSSCEKEYRHIHDKKKVAEKQLKTTAKEVKKLRKETSSAGETAVKSRQKSDAKASNAPSTSATSKLVSRFGGTSFAKKISTSSDSSTDKGTSDYKKAQQSMKQFKNAVGVYNKQLKEYNENYEKNKQSIVNMEVFRMESMMEVFKKLTTKQLSIRNDPRLTNLHSDILTKVDRLDAATVITNAITNMIDFHGKYQPPEPETTRMAFEYRDMFYSIDDAMAITRDADPDAKMPFIIPLLCDRVRETGGFETEGIFRKSPAASRRKALKKKLQIKDMHLSAEKDPNVYASLLKEWLRELIEPLIPEIYYDFCVDMAKKKKLNADQFKVFFSQLPAVNRYTLKYLVKFLRELTQPVHVEKTRMNIDNIAIVFGPTLLRSEALDPMMALQNAASEKEFVVALLEKAQVD